MSSRVIEVNEGLMALFQVAGTGGKRKLIVIEPPLNIEVCLDPIEITLALRTHDRLMVDLEPPTDGFKGVRRIGAPAIGHERRRSSIAEAGRVEDHERRPRRFCRGHGPRENSSGIALEHEDAPPLDAVQSKVHLPAIDKPILMPMLRLVGMRLWGGLGPGFGDMRDVIIDQLV